MTRQLPKPVAVPLGWVIFGAINAVIYSAGWACMRWDDLTDAIESRRAARALWREADQILKESAR
ncbi:hypothetical protein A5637_13285 [Mycolicibacterium fortuitum]|uniref:hypothetical protein n=1 Tax=Mycolicibacterium fortuitum TaxID=1766 RepID=UPI0007EC71A4|nr:hypothetical protein [Mycolicibacterium fortuitum]OBK04049.1 hypothetical protein A5637_13285 [Mycolicibacterium fortuitum]